MASGPEIARGHALAVGHGWGTAFVTDPVSFWGGISADDGVIIDVHHRDRGRSVAGTVLVMPGGRGSTNSTCLPSRNRRSPTLSPTMPAPMMTTRFAVRFMPQATRVRRS